MNGDNQSDSIKISSRPEQISMLSMIYIAHSRAISQPFWSRTKYKKAELLWSCRSLDESDGRHLDESDGRHLDESDMYISLELMAATEVFLI
jgi:hypothetical protein